MKTEKRVAKSYGSTPVNLGTLEIKCGEMMFYQYLPIKLCGQFFFALEARILCFYPLLLKAVNDFIDSKTWAEYRQFYIYLTAKHTFVSGKNSDNRPGWHSDGFMTEDINYIWSDKDATVFNKSNFDLTPDDKISLYEMDCQAFTQNNFIYPVKSLLRLDQFIIHRAPENCKPGYRTFFKLTFSKDKYNLIGNSHNYLLGYNWDMIERSEQRNITSK